MLQRPFIQCTNIITGMILLLLFSGMLQAQNQSSTLNSKERLGKKLFFEKISDPATQSCAACHGSNVGGTGPISGLNRHGSVKAYSHNGYFKSLWSIVHFYNTRDIKPVCADPFTTEKDALAQGCWPEPEIPQNVNRSELGNLGLSPQEERDLVQFLKTLSDGWSPNQ